tara:strand:+ start:972 stop:2096 length:1125 start_codon:yes stop_codon:yes gene_type:complete
MSLNIDSLEAVTRRQFIPVLVENLKRANVLTMRLLGKSKATAHGTKVLQPVEYGRTNAKGFYKGYDQLNITPNEFMTDATYDWSQAYVSIAISGLEESMNSGSERVIDLLTAKFKNAEKSLKELFANKIYGAGDGTAGTLVSLNAMLKQTGTFGAIDRDVTANGWWKGGFYENWVAQTNGYTSQQVNDLTQGVAVWGTGAGELDIQKILRSGVSKLTFGGDMPTIIVMPHFIFDRYEESLVAQQRYGGSSKELADSGFRNLLFRGIPVVPDDACPVDRIYFLNENYIHMRHHPKRNFSFSGYQKPVDYDTRVGQILWFGQMTASAPVTSGCYYGLPAEGGHASTNDNIGGSGSSGGDTYDMGDYPVVDLDSTPD